MKAHLMRPPNGYYFHCTLNDRVMVKMMLILAGRKDLWINTRSKPCSAPGWNTVKGQVTILYCEFVVCIIPSPLFIMGRTTMRYDSSLHNLFEFKVRSYIVYFGVLPSAIITHISSQAFVFIIQLNETPQKAKDGY
jgi:hypothetical protein